MLTRAQKLFLEILKASLNSDCCLTETISKDEEAKIFEIARIHHIMPLILQEIYDTGQTDPKNASYQQALAIAINDVAAQTLHTARFLEIYAYLQEKGLNPVIMKGIVIRSLYPMENYRISADEDLLIDRNNAADYYNALKKINILPEPSAPSLTHQDEIAFRDLDTGLLIELHMSPFSSNSKAYSRFNLLFSDRQYIYTYCGGKKVRTLSETDHLLYLLLHAVKHFMYSGFGIRQICDIILFSDRYKDRINWEILIRKLKKGNAYIFAITIFKIGDRYLLPNAHLTEYLIDQRATANGITSQECVSLNLVDDEPLLCDVFKGGLYGASSLIRLHSSNLTLHAAEQYNSKERMGGVFHALFPPINSMQGRYAYLKKAPILLPVAWGQRIIHYLIELRTDHGNEKRHTVLRSIEIGKDRIALLRQYDLIR